MRWPQPASGRKLSQNRTTLVPWSWTFSLQNCEQIDLCCLTHPIYGICYAVPAAYYSKKSIEWDQSSRRPREGESFQPQLVMLSRPTNLHPGAPTLSALYFLLKTSFPFSFTSWLLSSDFFLASSSVSPFRIGAAVFLRSKADSTSGHAVICPLLFHWRSRWGFECLVWGWKWGWGAGKVKWKLLVAICCVRWQREIEEGYAAI